MAQKEKKLLFSVTKDDMIIQTLRGTGKGGQNKNKVETAVRITHPESGAIGYSEDERMQLQNKKIAFDRLIKSEKFQKWHKWKTSWMLQGVNDIEREIEKRLDASMDDKNIKLEVRDEAGKWKKAGLNELR